MPQIAEEINLTTFKTVHIHCNRTELSNYPNHASLKTEVRTIE